MKFVSRIILLLILPGYLHASVVVVNGLSHTHTVSSVGSKVQGTIRVRNEGKKESRILVYRQDLLPECGKSPEYPEPDSHLRSIGNGLRTNVDEKALLADEEYDVKYLIDLQKDKFQPGTYWEVIMVEVADPVKEEVSSGIRVNSKVRYAIQVIVDVGEFEPPKLSFENVIFEKVSSSLAFLRVQMKNNSVFGTRTKVVLEVYALQGNKLKTTEPSNRILYPGFCTTFEIPLNDLVRGKYDCVIIADTGKDLFGSNISVQIE